MRYRGSKIAYGLVILAIATLSGCNSGDASVEGNRSVEPSALGEAYSSLLEQIEEAEAVLQARMEEAAAAEVEAQAEAARTAETSSPATPPSSSGGTKTGSSDTASSGVTVPSLIGMSFEEAAATLSALGLQVVRAEDYSERHASGLVCDQDPAGGAASSGSVVTLVVSLGHEVTACPSCGGDGVVTSTYTCPECGGTGYCYT